MGELPHLDGAYIFLPNVKVVAPPPLESEGAEIEKLKGGCPPTSCSESSVRGCGSYRWSIDAYHLESDLLRCHHMKRDWPNEYQELLALVARINQITGMSDGITIGGCLLGSLKSTYPPESHGESLQRDQNFPTPVESK